MGKFFEELAKKLAERWVALLVLPGALFVVLLAVVGVRLGHADPFDVGEVERTISDVAGTGSGRFGAQVLLLVAVLLAATGTGLAVQALAGVTRLVWLGRWPRPLSRWVVRRRRARWHALRDRRRALVRDHPGRYTDRRAPGGDRRHGCADDPYRARGTGSADLDGRPYVRRRAGGAAPERARPRLRGGPGCGWSCRKRCARRSSPPKPRSPARSRPAHGRGPTSCSA